MAKKIIVLTGAAGSVGRFVRPLLRARYQLRLCDTVTINDLSRNEKFVQGDLSDPAVAEAVVSGADGIIHLAGLVAPEVSFEDTLSPNYRAVLALLEACRKFSVRRFVFASTVHVMGLRPLTAVSPQTEISPDGFYGLSKAFGEAACVLYAHRFGIVTLIVRIGNVMPAVTDGRRERMWVSVRDLVQLLRIGLEGDDFKCETVYGISHVSDPIFNNDAATRLGYVPRDDSSKNRTTNFQPLSIIKPVKNRRQIGGGFAASPLPDPFVKTR